MIVDAEVKLGRETALNARVLRAATGVLLSGGALDRALGRLARELDEVALVAALELPRFGGHGLVRRLGPPLL